MDSEQSIVNIYKYEKCNFEEAFLVLKPCKILLGKTVCVEGLNCQEIVIVLILVVIPL